MSFRLPLPGRFGRKWYRNCKKVEIINKLVEFTDMRLIILLLCVSGIAFGPGYHPDEDLGVNLENITSGFSPHPPDSVIAGIQWLHYQNWYVTATVIAPNYIITAAHWNCSDGADPKWPIGYHLKKLGTESLKGTEYIIVDARGPFNVRMPQAGIQNPDLMICRVKRTDPADPNSSPEKYTSLEDADFPKWISFYEGNDEVGRTMISGCFGRIETSDRNWCELSKEQQQAVGRIRPPGTLHWGRNVLVKADKNYVWFLYDSTDQPGYVKDECYAAFGNSGAPMFIQDSNDWRLASLFTSCTSGPRISRQIKWINRQLLDMEGIKVSQSAKTDNP